MKAGTRPDPKMVSILEQEVDNLAGERRELEAHIERTDVWTQHLGRWTADVHSAEVGRANVVDLVCISTVSAQSRYSALPQLRHYPTFPTRMRKRRFILWILIWSLRNAGT